MQTKHGFNLFIVAIIAMLGVAGCVQPASEEIAPTEIGARTTFTPTFTPTDIPPPTETPTEIEVDAQTVVETETPTATATETATPTATATATEAESALIQGPTEVAQDDAPTLDPLLQQPTQPPVGVSESQLTATAIIAGATETQAFILTSTAAAQGIGIPTASPTATPDPGAGLAPGTVTPVTAGVVPGADCFHEVKTQDRSLYRLSLAYGVPINSIATASGILNPDLIRVGQMLTIPGCGTTGALPPPTSTPNPNTVAFGQGGAGANTSALATNPTGDCTWGTSVIFPNGCPTTTGTTTGSTATGTTGSTATDPGTGGPTIPAGSRTHTVAQGETLYEISLAYGVTMDVIASANGIANYDSIRFNQVLVIP
jgi:LysM repeat protein